MITPCADLLVHLVTRDNAALAKLAMNSLKADHLLILKTVLCQFALTLEYNYGLSWEQIRTALTCLVGLENATIEDSTSVELALQIYGPNLDFVAALTIAQSRTTSQLVTFDQGLAEAARENPLSPRVSLLEP